MMGTVTILIRIAFSIAAGILAGFSAVYAFNRIPAKWLCDYHQKPDPGMWEERIKPQPWTIVFILVFSASALKLTGQSYLYAIPGVVALWLLLQIGMADRKYSIIPDQFVIALAVAAFGFIPLHLSYQSQLLGALVGGGSILLMGIVGMLLFKKESMGFGDVKLFAAIGLLLGVKGVVIVLLFTVFSSALVFGIGIMTGRLKADDQQPLGPFISASAAAYILFRPELLTLAGLYMGQ
jgi:prepilin signal peptidase PulO-like enzyme (type II secretory pathway)